MTTTLLIFILAALIAEIAGTIGGFGSSIFFIPIAGFFFDFQTVLAITAILHVFSNSSKLFLFRNKIDYKLLLWLGIPSVLMVIVGAEVTVLATFKYIQLVLGGFIIVFSVLLFFYPGIKLPQSKLATVSAGSLAGFMAGLIGTGGAIRGMSLAAFNLSKETFVATSAAIDFGVDISRSAIYLSNDFLENKYYYLVPILFVVALLGSYIGKLFLNRIRVEAFRKIVLILLFVIGTLEVIKWFAS
jgi:uncharacterized membrane protein YfcA